MLNSSVGIWLGVTFVLVGAINVCLILQSSVRLKNASAGTRLVAAHRIGGYLFIALFCVIGYFMVARLGDVEAGAAPTTLVHMTLAMVLGPLLFVKVLVARYYKSYHSFLMPIGLFIFVLSFVLIGVTVGPSLAHRVNRQTVALPAIDMPPAAIDMNLAAQTMEKRCSKCHNLDRIAGARKDARGWLATVNRMRAFPDAGISEEDARIIVSYLASQLAPKGPTATANMEVARALVDQRCGRCHSLDRVYMTAQTPEQWRETVTRMAEYAAGSTGALQPGEDEQIIDYLSVTQSAEAVDQRKAQANAASSAGHSIIAQQASAVPAPPSVPGRYDLKMIGFISFVCLGAVVLIVRRPARGPLAAAKPDIALGTARNAAGGVPSLVPGGPLILRLASITQQTHDAKTLRFIVGDARKLDARPGQFLTFSFLFDGKKVVRSYSICSSPARSGYIEITPKRVSNGCASVFLNDRATLGLTVEANGPFGYFHFDEGKHENVVLIAAGSGITPMISMLRYMDDLCLETTATLLYCVRTIEDIIFKSELEQLKPRLKNFQYHILLSQPHAEWHGLSGRIRREIIESTVKATLSADFFLCGPPPFMDAARAILIDLGVKPGRIKQESFGAFAPKAPQQATLAAETGVTVEFVRSGRTCNVRAGQTVLEAAEEHGVAIPSSCRQGQCGTCKTKLLEGNVRMDAEEGLDPDSRAQGFVLTCVGHADGLVKLDA